MFTKNERKLSPVKRIAIVGIMAATLECGKLALAVLPNIEVVSLLLALYGYVFGSLGVLASFVFVAIEPLIWGFGPWVISYFLYWPLLPLVFSILARIKEPKASPNSEGKGARIRRSLTVAGIIFLLTLWFGVLTSLVDVGLFTGNFDRFFIRLGVYYLRGIPFYITHLVSNFLIFFLSFEPLCRMFFKIKKSL